MDNVTLIKEDIYNAVPLRYVTDREFAEAAIQVLVEMFTDNIAEDYDRDEYDQIEVQVNDLIEEILIYLEDKLMETTPDMNIIILSMVLLNMLDRGYKFAS